MALIRPIPNNGYNIEDIPNFTKAEQVLSGSTLSVSNATVGEIAIVKYAQSGTIQYPTTYSGLELIHNCSFQGNDTTFVSNVICFYKITSSSVSITIPSVTLTDTGNSNNLLYN